jgi:PiT family inorganic phosphate transporter
MDLSSGGFAIPFLVLAVGMALAFEFVNGFHDTANAVATVIYTRSLKPWHAVIWSGLWNLFGVLISSGAVAFGILALLPVELVIGSGSTAGFTMVIALLVSAIMWNVGTWWFGIPASSSHTLIGSIMGVGMVNSLMAKGAAFGDGVNWGKAREVFMSLLVSPIVGFVCAGALLLLLKLLVRKPELYKAPEGDSRPPLWIRSLLVITCTGVSFSHGSNDGQKGMGLVMLILIGLLPATFALRMSTDADTLATVRSQAAQAQTVLMAAAAGPGSATAAAVSAGAETSLGTDALSAYVKASGALAPETLPALAGVNQHIIDTLPASGTLESLSDGQRRDMRRSLYLVNASVSKLGAKKAFDKDQMRSLKDYQASIDRITKFIPLWVKVAVAFALGLGTMIGWKRIVVTVGEKIGKTHLTYAQGASAELVAMVTIYGATQVGLPVSTTHVLASGVAGTMAANGSGLQTRTLISLLTAWVLTLPVCVILGSGIFAAGLYVMLTVAGIH